MPHSPFHFKQFTIHQDKCTMKVGTDAVLLGAWTKAEDAKTILDIGTGTGIIAIMLAQKSNAQIDALDIDKRSCEQAACNAQQSPWKDRIKVLHASLQGFVRGMQQAPVIRYDLIVSNPPYFDDKYRSSIDALNKTKHNDTLAFDDLINGAVALLEQEGRFCLILPLKEGVIFIKKALRKGLHCSKMLKVRTKIEKQEKRLLMEFRKAPVQYSETEIVVQEENLAYTKEYIELTKDYYLAF